VQDQTSSGNQKHLRFRYRYDPVFLLPFQGCIQVTGDIAAH
jgi:hypothetical protein